MRLQPNITSLDKVTAFILSQEADELDKRSTQSKANRENRVDDKVDKVGPPRVKKYKCRICNKTHEKCQCGYTCEHCHRKGHISEKCWIKFPNLAPQGAAPPAPPAKEKDRREKTPHPLPKKQGDRSWRRSSAGRSDRGISFERSASEAESPRDHGTRKGHRSNRIIAQPSSSSGPLGQWRPSQHLLFPEP